MKIGVRVGGLSLLPGRRPHRLHACNGAERMGTEPGCDRFFRQSFLFVVMFHPPFMGPLVPPPMVFVNVWNEPTVTGMAM